MSSHRKNNSMSIKVNGREVENPVARVAIAIAVGIAGIAVLALGMLFLTGAMFFMIPVIVAVIVAAGIACIFARGKG